MSRVGITVIFTVLASVLLGCGDASEDNRITLPTTPVLSEQDRHFVVTAPYVRARAQAGRQADIVNILRAGEVYPVVGRSADEDVVFERRGVWYHLQMEAAVYGWVFSDRGRVYATEDRAVDASRGIR